MMEKTSKWTAQLDAQDSGRDTAQLGLGLTPSAEGGGPLLHSANVEQFVAWGLATSWLSEVPNGNRSGHRPKIQPTGSAKAWRTVGCSNCVRYSSS
jgi:hypothetical protein